MLWLASKSVYVGDLRCLLQALDVLRDEVEFTPDKLLCSVFPMSHAVYDYMRGVTLARANASYSSRELISIVANQPEDPEPTFEYNIFMRELLNHMRDTPDHPGGLGGATGRCQDPEHSADLDKRPRLPPAIRRNAESAYHEQLP